MTNNVYSLLVSYFRYQRDIGIGEVIFADGSGIREILSPAPAPLPRAPQAQGRGGHAARSGIAAKSAGAADPSPLSRLSRLRPVGELGLTRTGRGAAPARAHSPKRERLAVLYREALGCGECALSKSRVKVVFSSGTAEGQLFIIGAAPMPQDETTGLSFQGETGALLDRILDKMGLSRGTNVFATYLQKCFNAEGFKDYDDGGFDISCAKVCRKILDRQLDIVDPKAILVFGQPAANLLLGNDDGMERLRGRGHKYKGKPVVVTYDLAFMLKETKYRHGAWDDMKKVMSLLSS